MLKISNVTIDCDEIVDCDAFHSVFAQKLGFPDYYGRNIDAWIDCMTSVDAPGDGLTTVHCEKGSIFTIDLLNIKDLKRRQPDIHEAILACSAFVNWRRIEAGEKAVLALSYYA